MFARIPVLVRWSGVVLCLLSARPVAAQPLWHTVTGKAVAECASEASASLVPVACVVPDLGVVRRLLSDGVGSEVDPGGSAGRFVVDRVLQRADGGSLAAAGSVDPRRRFQATLHGEHFTAWVQDHGATHEVRPGAGGMHALYRVVEGAVRLVEPPAVPDVGALFDGDPASSSEPAAEGSTAFLSPSAAEVTILVAYTTAVKNRLGTSGLASRVQSLQDWLNQAFVNSGHPEITARVVGTVETTYTPSTSMSTDVDRLLNPSDGFLDDLHPQRVSAGADLLHLLIPDQTDACGIAYVPHDLRPDLGVGLSAASCPLSTFAHEIGHNFGMGHDSYVSASDAWWPWAYGYVDPDFRFRTIMAYSNQCSAAGRTCPEVQYFSDPDRTYQGYPLGIPFVQGGRSADNVRVLEDMVGNVADNSRYLHPACDWTLRSMSVSPNTLSSSTVSNFRATLEAGSGGCSLERVRLEFAPAGSGSSAPTYPAGSHEITASAGQQIQLSSSFTVNSAGLPAGSFQPRVLIVRRGYYWYINTNTTVTSGVAVEPDAVLPADPGLSAPWPNPAMDRVHVRLQSGGAASRSLRIFDALGRPALAVEVAAGENDVAVDVSGLPRGVYFLRVSGEAGARAISVVR